MPENADTKSSLTSLGFGDLLSLAAGVLLTIATVLLSVTLPQIWDMAQDIGGLKKGQENIVLSVADLDSSVKKGFATTNTTLSTLISRVNAQETDPKELLAKAGVPISGDYTVYVMGEDFIVFPTTEAALKKMMDDGLKTTRITPYLEGFVIPHKSLTSAP